MDWAHRAVIFAIARLSCTYLIFVLNCTTGGGGDENYAPHCSELSQLQQQLLLPKIFNKLLFGWTPWMYWPNLKSIVLPVPEIIGCTQKNWEVLEYAHDPFSLKFLMGFVRMDPVNVSAKICSPCYFTRKNLFDIRPKLHHRRWRKLRVILLRTFSTSPAACWCCSYPLSGNSVIICLAL